MPAIVEADDDGMYVLKFRGAGQGPKVLIAELLVGELARAAGLPVPTIVLIELDADLARTEPDPEIQALIRASTGLNVALDYLPGASNFDPVANQVDPLLASQVVWLDACMSNVDRTARNPNMLMWHRQLYLIDHGAALYFHHAGGDYLSRAGERFPMIRDHVLLPQASELEQAHELMRARLTPDVVQHNVAKIPDALLEGDPAIASPQAGRDAYASYLLRRLEASQAFLQEALSARAQLV